MGRTALFTAALWLMFSGTLAVNGFIFKDNVSAESAAKLYRHMPGAVYASAAPYGAYSFQIPRYISAQQTAASKIVPVNESFQNAYLKDSYGNRFVEALQSMKQFPFKPFPQQYVQLQELPAHFTQPLAAPLNYQQYKPSQPSSSQQIIVGSHYRLPVAQAAAPTQANQYSYAQTHPNVHVGGIKNIAPASYSNPYRPQLGPVIQLPVHSAAAYQDSHKTPTFTPTVQTFSPSVSESHQQPNAQQQSSSHNAIYANTQPQEHYHHLSGEHKFQRLQEAPQEASYEEEEIEPPAPVRHVVHKDNVKLKTAAIRDTPIPTIVNGKKTVVNVETKPPIPLLDISLLEPLTFDNPLVPQVQHFLPRIAQATYHKLPGQNDQKKYQKEIVVQKSKSYDSGIIKWKPKKVAPKKKHRVTEIEHNYDDVYVPQATARPTVTVQAPDDTPEISYEINSPNYKETYKEKAVKYNKETQSEPVQYTYGTNTHKEPVHYSYTHSSKEPVTIQEVRYEGKGEAPKHVIHKFKSNHDNKESENTENDEDSGESHNSDDDALQHQHHHTEQHSNDALQHPQNQQHHHTEHHSNDAPQHPYHHQYHHTEHHSNEASKPRHYHEAEHRDHHKPSHADHKHHHKPASDSHSVQHHETHSNKHGQGGHYHSLDDVPFEKVAEYEEDIGITAPIKVDPNQHVQQRPPPTQSPRSSDEPQRHFHHHDSPAPQHHSKTSSNPHHEPPSTHVQERTKQVYIQEETPEDDESVGGHFTKSMFGKEEDKEKDFEKAYQNAAFGFPAYDKSSVDVEKDIYNPESYGVPRDHANYDIDHAPFQQYHEQGDSFPKEMRLSYKDDRDKTKEEYFLDYSVSKPESLLDRYKNKVDYYKLYKNQKPEKYVVHNDDNKKPKQSEKLTAMPYSYFPIPEDKMKQFFAQYNTAPLMFEYDYSKGLPKDSSAYASRPFQMLKMKTHFVEPQFQYGFEPILLPRLLDSELAAMATNNSPESEKPGTRKKIYKENFYIKKTSMSDAKPNS